MRTIDEPEITVFGDTGRRGEYRVHTVASDQHTALAWIHRLQHRAREDGGHLEWHTEIITPGRRPG
eukprot:1313143-Lingulodinium_polyedra.AAC.1